MDKTQSKEDLFPGIAGYKPNPKKPCPHCQCHQSQGMCDECGHCRIHCGTCGSSKRSWKCLHSRRCICVSFHYWVEQHGSSAAERVLEAEREVLKSDDPPELLELFPNPKQIDAKLAWENMRASRDVATAENELFDADQAVQKAQASLTDGSGSQEAVAAAKDQQAACITKVAEKTVIAQKLNKEAKASLQAAKDLKGSTVLLSLRYLKNLRCKRHLENSCESAEPPIKKTMAQVDANAGHSSFF